MSTIVPRTDGDALTPPPIGTALANEETLHQVFLAQYSTLIAEARTKLGVDAAVLAAKCVEGTFVRAWDGRTRFQTLDAVNHFLIEDTHHAAARALSRRAAAHRFAGHDAHADAHKAAETTIDQSWTNVMHALHGEEHSSSTLAAVAAASRHEAADHIGAVGKSKSIVLAATLGAVAIAAVVGGMYAMDQAAAKMKVTKALGGSDVRVINTPPGRAGTIDLGDGSTAHMAPESKLTIPKDFGPTLRGVGIEGATTFDVAKGLPQQFEVHARNAVVVATGTSFTVSAYPADSQMTVVVSEGAVDIKLGEVVRSVGAGAGLVVNDKGTIRVATAEERDEASGWRTGTLALQNRSLKDALAHVKRWYGYEIRVPHESLLARKVTVRASLDSGMQAIRLIEQSSGLEFGYAGQNMVFRERGSGGTKKR